MKSTLYIKLFLLFVFSFILHTISFSQKKNNQPKAIGFYFTPMFEASNYHLGISIKPTIRINKNLISIRQIITRKEQTPNHPIQGLYPNTQSYSEISLLYGRFLELKHGFMSLSIGGAYIEGIKRGDFLYSERHEGLLGEDLGTESHYYESIDLSGFGIPIVAETFLNTPSSIFRLGLSTSITIHADYIFYSAGIGIQLRKKTQK